jgi:hypothetical protein
LLLTRRYPECYALRSGPDGWLGVFSNTETRRDYTEIIILEPMRNVQLCIIMTLLIYTVVSPGCKDKPDDPDVNESFPTLKIVNELEEDWRSITKVSLVGYNFSSLNIEAKGDAQTFKLEKGMPGGNENINVSVTYIRYKTVSIITLGIEVDFTDGETTIVYLRGCAGSTSQCLYSL